MISVPKGMSASLAILKHCFPEGIPMIVMQKTTPTIAASIASGTPEITIQRRFRIIEPAPPPYRTSFPKGNRQSFANLKHCTPQGIPIMVMHQRIPASAQLIHMIRPATINQIKFPINFIIASFNCAVKASSTQ